MSGFEDFGDDLENPVAQLPREFNMERPLPKSDDGVLKIKLCYLRYRPEWSKNLSC